MHKPRTISREHIHALIERESATFLAQHPKSQDRKSTRLNSSHLKLSRMPSSA